MPALDDFPLENDKCLVVEDDDTLRMLVSRCARAHGFDVEEHGQAEALWDVADWTAYPLVLLDWELPGAPGLALCRHIRQRPGGDVPVIVMITARDALEDVGQALDAGADDYVVKPFSVDQLRVRLKIADRQTAERRERHSAYRALEQVEAQHRDSIDKLPKAISSRMVALSAVTAGVVHDINNPLSYVIANLRDVREQLIERGSSDDATLIDALFEAEEGAERVHRIVRDLGTFSRGQRDRCDAIDLHQVLDACANLAWNEIRHRATLVKDYGQLPIVQGDRSALAQALLNLVLNAVHALPEGQASLHRLELKTYTNARGEAVVEVADDGRGMDEETLARAFDPMFSTRADDGATGMGLPIAASVVRGLGGEVELDSEPGQGTRARVRLPRGDFSGVDGDDLDVLRPPSRERARARVLVVDDEDSVARALRRTIGRQHDVDVVTDAASALERLRSRDYDVVFCDIMMPDVTGMDLYDAVRESCPGMESRVVFMTGGAFTQRARAFLEGVPNLHIEKPFDRETIHQILDDTLLPSQPPFADAG